MVNSKEITREIEPSVPICEYCKQLVAERCKTDSEFMNCERCNYDTLSFYFSDDFNPELN